RGAGLHDLRAQARVRDRLSSVPAVPDHRPGGRLGADVDGHDDAAAGGGVAAVQAHLLRAGRRLEPGGRQPGAELRDVSGGARALICLNSIFGPFPPGRGTGRGRTEYARFRETSQMHSAILAPVVALVLWTFVMWVWLYATRIPAMSRHRIVHD